MSTNMSTMATTTVPSNTYNTSITNTTTIVPNTVTYTNGPIFPMYNYNYNVTLPLEDSVIKLFNDSGEIVRVNKDGTVIWNKNIDIDEAAKAFGKSLTLGAEISIGITEKTKLNMRDSVFNDLITIAKDKGSLTADDLTYLLEASKIVEKLKGPKE